MFWLFKFLKLLHTVVISNNINSLSSSYFEHSNKKCNSSSITFEEHFVHILLCRGTPWYLPNYICNLCEDVHSFVKLLHSSKLLTMVRYFSRPKLFLHILHIFSLLSENLLFCFFHSVMYFYNEWKQMIMVEGKQFVFSIIFLWLFNNIWAVRMIGVETEDINLLQVTDNLTHFATDVDQSHNLSVVRHWLHRLM